MKSRSCAQWLRLILLIVLMAPIWLVMIFTGFPPPLPPGQQRRPAQAQTQPWRQQRQAARQAAGFKRFSRTEPWQPTAVRQQRR